MSKKKEILSKIKIMITQRFDDPESAFNFFDKNQDGALSKKEIKRLLDAAKINGLIKGIVAKKMLKELDKNKNKKLSWAEFKDVLNDLLKKY